VQIRQLSTTSLTLLQLKRSAATTQAKWKWVEAIYQYYYLEDFGILAWMSVGILLSYYHYHQQELKLDYRLEGFGK